MTTSEAIALLSKGYAIKFDGHTAYLSKSGGETISLEVSLFNVLLKNSIIGLRGGSTVAFVISDWYKSVGQFRAKSLSPAN